MVHIKSTSLAVLLGSAALSSAAAIPAKRGQNEHSGVLMGKRSWRGRHGARGPLRSGDEHYLINLDLTGDGPHHNGYGDLIDLNTREMAEVHAGPSTPLNVHVSHSRSLLFTPEEEDLVRAELKAHMKRTEPLVALPNGAKPLIDAHAIAELKARDDRLLDLAAKIFVGTQSRRDSVDLSAIEAAAKAVGVSDEQIADAKNAVDSLSPAQKLEVENAVRHAMWSTAKPGEKRAVAARSDEEDMGGAAGWIDIFSPLFNSTTGQKIASLVLATNGTNDNSTFVLNASSSVRTKVYMVPLNTTDSEHKDGEPLKVNLKVPVFVADTASVEPFCATFDPSPDAPQPMTVDPCEEPEGDRSQIFLYDPETGRVKPNWTPTKEASEILSKVPDTVSSEVPSASATASSAISTASSVVSASTTAPIAAQSASSEAATPTLSESSIASSMPESSTIPDLPSSSVADFTSSIVEAIPTSVSEVSSAIAAASSAAEVSSVAPELPSPSAAVSAASSIAPPIPTPVLPASSIEPAASSAAPVASASAATSNIDLIFTPSHASVMSVDDDDEPVPVNEVNNFLPEHTHAARAMDDCVEMSAAPTTPKPKAKAGAKLPEGQRNGDGKKVSLGKGEVKVEGMKARADQRLGARFLRRQQTAFMAPKDVFAPYEWVWTKVDSSA